MPVVHASGFSRVFGDAAVLRRLEHLGRRTRIFPHLVAVGFPGAQLEASIQWYANAAATPVAQYAARNMVKGFFEDEALLTLFGRYYECSDWKLENSPWFFSPAEYNRFFDAVLEPLAVAQRQLEQGLAQERWGRLFDRFPFDLALEAVFQALWAEATQQEHFWKPQASYAHFRASTLFGYLQRTLNVLHPNPDAANYHWERGFRERLVGLQAELARLLAAAVPVWRDSHRQGGPGGERGRRTDTRSRARRQGRGYDQTAFILAPRAVLGAFATLQLDSSQATMGEVRRAFRRLSKLTHPDSGGSPEAFRALSQCLEVAEAWLARSGGA